MTSKGAALLKGWIKVGADTYMSKKTFEKYSLDNELSPNEKQILYSSGDRHEQLYETFKSRKRSVRDGSGAEHNETKQQLQSSTPTRQKNWKDKEIKELSPAFIDPRIESLKHLHPHQLNTWQ